MLPVTKIQRFCTKDGPGVRTTVFLKGCPLRCVWCHNPETAGDAPPLFYTDSLCVRCGACEEVCPRQAHRLIEEAHTFDRSRCNGCQQCTSVCPTAALEPSVVWLSEEEIFSRVMVDAPFYGKTGGVTFSGGEPLLHTTALVPLARRFREAGIGVAVETCGYGDPADVAAMTAAADLFLWDLKDTDERRHRANIGVSPEPILRNLRAADALGARIVLRCILLRTVNLEEAHLREIAAIFRSLRHGIRVDLIPYHPYGDSKNGQLGRPGAAHPEWIPTPEELDRAEAFLRPLVPVGRG